MKNPELDKVVYEHVAFTPALYKELLCQYLQALGDDFLLSHQDLMQNNRGVFILNIRKRLMSNMKLTRKQNRALVLIETELAKQLKEKNIMETLTGEDTNGEKEIKES